MSFTDKLLTTIALSIVTGIVLVILWAAVYVTWAIVDWIANKWERIGRWRNN